jgi:hypothetical protein
LYLFTHFRTTLGVVLYSLDVALFPYTSANLTRSYG